jgi:polysaccharide pyruvyl transferase WcaK-like protein
MIFKKDAGENQKGNYLGSLLMLIEIRGTDFVNKGAELMLNAVHQKVSSELPDTSFVTAPYVNDYQSRLELGLYQKIWFQRYGIQWGRLGLLIPKKLRKAYGMILDKEINVVLDASGFSYSDQWGDSPSLIMASCTRKWKKRGVKVILLPQAMGPFTSNKIRKAFTFIAENADLVFPRDDISYKHVTELVGKRDNVFQAPDFTNIVSGKMPDNPEKFKGRYCLIPNYRMIDKTSDGQSIHYSSFCATCLKYLVELGQKPFILIHEGTNDMKLAEKIVEESGNKIEIFRETNALKIKGIIGLCDGVISSRFHGLVSALSQGVPSIATGWSHKYDMLFKEYGLSDGCISVTIDNQVLRNKIEQITQQNSRKEIISNITKAAALYKKQTEAMWQKVFKTI